MSILSMLRTPPHDRALPILSFPAVQKMDATVDQLVHSAELMAQAMEIAGPKATVMLFGLTSPQEELTVRPFEMFKKELTVKTSYINPYTQSRALRLIDTGRVDVASCVAACRPLEDLPRVLADPALRRDGKVIICPWMEE